MSRTYENAVAHCHWPRECDGPPGDEQCEAVIASPGHGYWMDCTDVPPIFDDIWHCPECFAKWKAHFEHQTWN